MTNAPPQDIGQLLNLIAAAYSYRVEQCGPVANGVFWKDPDGQVLRYEVLLQAIPTHDLDQPITINDLGCGYGALFDLLVDQAVLDQGQYFGYDISPPMIKQAQARHPRHSTPHAQFIESPIATQTADYSFVSGTYNMHFGARADVWEPYVKTSLQRLWAKTTKTLAFNMLDRAAQPDKPAQRDPTALYYGDRGDFIRFALSLSPEVEVIDDYPLDEFTIYVKRV